MHWIPGEAVHVLSASVTVQTSWSAGAFSPVNLKGLHLGWKQTQIYLQVSHSTSHYSSLFFSNHNSNFIHNSDCKLRKTIRCLEQLKPIHILWTLNTGTCIQQGDLFYHCSDYFLSQWTLSDTVFFWSHITAIWDLWIPARKSRAH